MPARTLVLSLLAAGALAACGPRQVEVRTAPAVASRAEVALHLTNRLDKAVNVYVRTGGADRFVRQVAANTTAHLPVPAVAAGSRATLRATTIDGAVTYERRDVELSGTVPWSLP